jgi:hypothetical protein
MPSKVSVQIQQIFLIAWALIELKTQGDVLG